MVDSEAIWTPSSIGCLDFFGRHTTTNTRNNANAVGMCSSPDTVKKDPGIVGTVPVCTIFPLIPYESSFPNTRLLIFQYLWGGRLSGGTWRVRALVGFTYCSKISLACHRTMCSMPRTDARVQYLDITREILCSTRRFALMTPHQRIPFALL